MASSSSIAIRNIGFVGISQVLAGLMSLATAIVLSRLMGPSDFAIYTICLALTASLAPISRLGVSAWLMSRQTDPELEHFNIALGGMLLVSLLVALLTGCALSILEQFSNVEGLFWPALFALALLPLEVVSLPALTRLERALDYGQVMKISLWSQFIGQIAGVVLVFSGLGIWGVLVGWLIRSSYTNLACWSAVGQFPRVQWNFEMLMEMLRFGIGHTISTSLNASKNLIFLSAIGQWFGKDAVGIMGLAFRVVEFITPLRAVASRIIVPIIAPATEVGRRLNFTQQKSSEIETLITIPIAVLGLLLYSTLGVPLIGDLWQDSLIIMPWVLASRILVLPHMASYSALNVRGFFRVSIIINAVGIILILKCMFILGSAFGLEGMAASLLISWFPSILIHWVAKNKLGFSLNHHAQLWAWGGVFVCLSIRFGLVFLAFSSIYFFFGRYKIKKTLMYVLKALKK